MDRALAEIADRRHQAVPLAQAAPAPAPTPQPVAAAPAAAAPPPPAPAPAPADNDLLVQARLLHAQDEVADAKAAEQSGNYRSAVQLYQEALRLDPGNVQAKTGLAMAEAKANSTEAAPADQIQTTIADLDIHRAAAVMEFRSLMNRADALAKDRQYAAANEAVQQAKIVLDRNQRLLPPDQYQSLREEAVNLNATLNDEARVEQARQVQAIEEERTKEAQQRREQALKEQDEEVQRLLRRAADLRHEQNYDKALELINQALFLQPNNVAAQAMKEMVEDSRLYVTTKDLVRRRDLLYAQHRVENMEASMPYTELMTYPPDWPELTNRRLGEVEEISGESEVNLRAAAKLQEPLPVTFDANKFSSVIDYFNKITTLDFDVKWARLSDAGIEQDTPVTANFASIPAAKALTTILDALSPPNDPHNHLDYAITDGIVKISTHDDLTSPENLILHVYDIRDLLIEPQGVGGNAGQLAGASATNGAGGGGGGSAVPTNVPSPVSATRADTLTRLENRIYDDVGVPADWRQRANGFSTIDDFNNNLLIRTTAKNHKDIRGLLTLLRTTRAIQITVESRLLFVNQGFIDDFGLDIDAQINNLGNNWGPIRIGQDSIGFTPESLPTRSLHPGSSWPARAAAPAAAVLRPPAAVRLPLSSLPARASPARARRSISMPPT